MKKTDSGLSAGKCRSRRNDYKINERSIPVGFNRPGIIFDYHLMPITSQVRNFMLSSRAQRAILLLRS